MNNIFTDEEWSEFLQELEDCRGLVGPFLSNDAEYRNQSQFVDLNSLVAGVNPASIALGKLISVNSLRASFKDAIDTAKRLSDGNLHLRDPGPDTFFKVGKSLELHFRYIWFGNDYSSFNNPEFTLSKVIHQIRQYMLGYTEEPAYEYYNYNEKEMIKIIPVGTKHTIFLNRKNKEVFFKMCDLHRKINRLRNQCAHRSPKSWGELDVFWSEIENAMLEFIRCFDSIYNH